MCGYDEWKKENKTKLKRKMVIYVDVDETVAITPENRDYNQSIPNKEMISNINRLAHMGHEIHYYTARGSGSGKDWFNVTYDQLVYWGCKFFGLTMGKPMYDFIIDDRSLRPEETEWLIKTTQKMMCDEIDADIDAEII